MYIYFISIPLSCIICLYAYPHLYLILDLINAHSCTLILLMFVLLTRVTYSSQEHVVRELDIGYGSGLSSLSTVAEFANEVCAGASVSISTSAP